VDTNAHTAIGIPVTAGPETIEPGLLVTSDELTGTPTRAGGPMARPAAADTPTTAGNRPPPRDERAGLLTGVLFEGKYQVGPLLGEGGMGQVYRATHLLMRKDVALKVLRPAMSVHPEIVERFRREAESAARLSHPHIISVLDFGRAVDGTFFLVMEFIVGSSLTAALRDGPLPWRRVCRLGMQMLGALGEAHRAGVVHRDLKPDNIMLQVNAAGEENLKIVDFGIAKLVEGGGPQLTAAGLVFGTPSYLSPEQAQGRPVTHHADLYAMGVILFQMLTGRLPFKAASTMELLSLHIQEPPPRVRHLNPDVPAILDELVFRALGKTPEQRPADALEMQETLGAALAAMPEPRNDLAPDAPTTGRLPPPPPPASRGLPKPAKVALAGLTLCVVGGLLYFAITARSSGKSADEPPKSGGAQELESPGGDDDAVSAGLTRVTPRPPASAPRDRTALVQALKTVDGARFSGKDRSLRRSMDTIAGILVQDPGLKNDPALHAHLNNTLLSRNHWHRQLTLKLIREQFSQATPLELKFLLVALNDVKFDTDHRHELYLFLKSRGLTEGIDEEGFWTAQLRWGTSCGLRLEASQWFKEHGHRGNLTILKAEAAKRFFHLHTGSTQSSDCYRPTLLEAVTDAEGRDPGRPTP
jgi:serine/threonine-protein kinase